MPPPKLLAYLVKFFINFGHGNLRQAEAWIALLAGAVEVNALIQGSLRQFTQWQWIEHPTLLLRGGHCTTELLPMFQAILNEAFVTLSLFLKSYSAKRIAGLENHQAMSRVSFSEDRCQLDKLLWTPDEDARGGIADFLVLAQQLFFGW